MAGDEENPEIVDEEGDARDYLDILSAWFFEKSSEPDYLYTAIEIKDLTQAKLGQLYSIHWTYNRVVYVSGLDVYGLFDLKIWKAGVYGHGYAWEWKRIPVCQGDYDKETGVITWKIPKSNIGNPEPGDVLTETCAYSAQFGISPALSILTMFKGFRDWTHEYGENYGKDYVVEY